MPKFSTDKAKHSMQFSFLLILSESCEEKNHWDNSSDSAYRDLALRQVR